MVGNKKNMDDFCYYKCCDCGKRYLGYPPEQCSCSCRTFNLVMGEEWWDRSGKGNRVLETVRR